MIVSSIIYQAYNVTNGGPLGCLEEDEEPLEGNENGFPGTALLT